MKDGKWEGKFFEFIFPKKVIRQNIHVPEGVFRTFETIHKDSPDYEGFRRKQLNEGKQIPVFFTYCSNNTDEIDSVGISYMYRYPAFNSVYNGIPIELLDMKRRDLPECIFGYTSQNDSLKGRVVFSNAFLMGNPVVLQKMLDEKLIDYILDRVNFLKASIRPHHAKYNRGEIFINFLLDYPNPSEKVLRFFKILSYQLY